MSKKRYKLTINPNPAYGLSGEQWAFVKKVKGGFETLHKFHSCKDYSHEIITNSVHGSIKFNTVKCNNLDDLKLDKLRIALSFSTSNPNFKKNLYSIKRYLNTIEKSCKVPQTTIVEIESGYENSRVFILQSDKIYIESPVLMHGLMALMRTMYHAKRNVSVANVQNTIDNIGVRDNAVLKFVIKHDIFELIMGKHKQIFGNLTLKDVYPGKGIGYHSGFGMVALWRRKLTAEKYAENVYSVLSKANVPKYPLLEVPSEANTV